MAITDQQIRDWVANNPRASEAQIAQAMANNGVSAAQVAAAIGGAPLPNAPPEVQIAQYQNYIARDPRFTDLNRAAATQLYGVDAQELQSIGVSPEQAQAIIQRQAQQTATPGQVTDEQIKSWVLSNPGASPMQISEQMSKFGLTDAQVARALGVVPESIRDTRAEAIPTGLLGFEEATRQGITDASGTLRSAQTEARAALDPAMEEVARLYNLNIEGLQQAGATARSDIERTYGAAGQLFQPYQQAGTTALQQELALSGALGGDAFNQAYQESPYVKFLREQGERSTLAGASATGGLGGGRVQQELVRFGQGLASQGLQQQIQNLRALSGQGLQAAGSGAEIQTGMGVNLSNIGTGVAQNVAAQRGSLASERSNYGTNVANLATSTGTNIANLQATGASNIASQRANVGQQLSNQIGNAAVGLGNLATGQSTALANLTGQYGQAGLNLQQGYTADQIAAYQAAADQEAAAQQGYGLNVASALGGQPFTQQQPTNYGQMFGNAANAAALGYDLSMIAPYRPAGAEYARPTRLPSGMVPPPAQGNYANLQGNWIANNSFQAARLAGRV